ncbi:MAG: hypothetical protein ACRCUM_02770 [Mycoplasmoidaceae bacterium]
MKRYINSYVSKKVKKKLDKNNICKFKIYEYRGKFIASGTLTQKEFNTAKEAKRYVSRVLMME